ncbi:MAG: PQQ-binding-like beta-propeller repeat protein [Saprospiraceae bacterium]|nr:PQQ-binding-like beta-propeller repeat protein [Saprospiraceae bacterium]
MSRIKHVLKLAKAKITILGLVVGAMFVTIYLWPSIMFKPNNWQQAIPDVASSSSSPRAVDLNQDKVKDIVIGAGGREFSPSESGVLAIDGATGQVLWKVPARNQVVGSAVFQDINADDIPDVFIGGRSAIFLALNGSDGTKLWEFLPDNDSLDYINDTTILNFYSAQLIPDIDGDGFRDLLTAYGGFIKARPDEVDRPTGYLMIFSAKSGRILAKAAMPDSRETYFSPVVHDFQDSGELEVIFGTGGEDIDGHLYRVALRDVIRNDLSQVEVLANGKGKGFIAPPVLMDVNLDGFTDIILNSVDGRLICIDGVTSKIIWEASLGDTFDTYTVPAPGYLVGDDSIPDFFSSFGKGPWPFTEYTVHTLTDGKNGQIVFRDTLGTFQYASPLVCDITHDGKHDVLVAVNTTIMNTMNGREMRWAGNDIMVYPGGSGTPMRFQQTLLGSNLGATPLITDLDGDDHLDVLRTIVHNESQIYSEGSLTLERTELKVKTKEIFWGGYMGTNGSSLVNH